MNWSYLWALLIALGIAGWVASGEMSRKSEAEAAISPEETNVEEAAKLVSVRVVKSIAVDHARTISLRGRTQADRMVEVRAETAGRVVNRPVTKGQEVSKGALLCQLSVDDRQAWLAESQASLRQQEIEFNAAETLVKKGYRSKTNAAATEAALDAARAGVERMRVEMARTSIKSPFGGVVDETAAEIGDYLSVGSVCATIVDADPIRVVGFISERELNLVSVGNSATAILAVGGQVDGAIQFISRVADPATRTFRVELAVPNPGNRLRDGVSAEIALKAAKLPAHLVSPAVLTLNSEGELGVRIIDGEDIVQFQPVTVLEDTTDGVWITGLADTVGIIVVGQEYVIDGEKVAVTVISPENS